MIINVIMHQLSPQAQYDPGSTFAQRIGELRDDKTAVAIFIVKHFLGDGTRVFISDGSSTFYVGLELFYQGTPRMRLCTNHLAIAHESALCPRPLARSKVEVCGGEVNEDLMMLAGPMAQQCARAVSGQVGYVILSVRMLFANRGPVGLESESMDIKRAAVSSPEPAIILIADHEKLSHPYSPNRNWVYGEELWSKLLHEKKNLYVVSTRRPGIDYAMADNDGIPKTPVTAEQQYLRNRALLKLELGERFIEVTWDQPAPPAQPAARAARPVRAAVPAGQ